MTAILSFENLISWFAQVSVIALIGGALPIVLRIRHPRSQLSYCHLVLLACLVLPLLQPWHHPLVIMSNVSTAAVSAGNRIHWFAILEWIFAAGIVLKVAWLFIGLRQGFQFRRAATRLFAISESIRRARELTRTDAAFYLSSRVNGPATFGFFSPVVLLPENFHAMAPSAQLSIACHELIHVQRRDWIVTLIEEFAGALLWFNPAVCWLLAQTKLRREELVDLEVVALTTERASYVEALLAMAVVAKPLPVPAARFFTEGHLHQRMKALLSAEPGSFVRLASSYAGMCIVIVITGWVSMQIFPLVGLARTVATRQVMVLPPIL